MQRWTVPVNDVYKTAHVLCIDAPWWAFAVDYLLIHVTGRLCTLLRYIPRPRTRCRYGDTGSYTWRDWYGDWGQWLWGGVMPLQDALHKKWWRPFTWFDITWDQARSYYEAHPELAWDIEWDGSVGTRLPTEEVDLRIRRIVPRED